MFLGDIELTHVTQLIVSEYKMPLCVTLEVTISTVENIHDNVIVEVLLCIYGLLDYLHWTVHVEMPRYVCVFFLV